MNKLKLYPSDSSEFESNGLGILKDVLEAKVVEERNRMFELELVYPINSFLFEQLNNRNIAKCDASDTLKNQLFRIYKTVKMRSNRIKVYARHISFDLMRDRVRYISIENQSCEYVLNQIFRNSQNSRHFKGYSNIQNAQNYHIERTSCLEAIAGTKGSIIDTFGNGPDILRDNFNIYVLNRRGNEDNVLISYRKNMTGIEIDEDDTDMITHIFPFATIRGEGGTETIIDVEEGVKSVRYDNYDVKYCKDIDFTDKFKNGEIPTQANLIELSKKYFEDNRCDIPKTNFKVNFVTLGNTEDYKEWKDLEKVGLGDTIIIRDSRYKVDTQARVIRVDYNVLTGMYNSIELGEPRDSLKDIIGDNDKPQQGPVGPMGPAGTPGESGEDGKVYYTWIRYADDKYGNGMSNLPANKEYLGLAYNKESFIESNNPSDYVWSKYVGDQGIPGYPGEDGITLYTWLKYADDEQGNGISDVSINKEYIGLAYNKTIQQESSNPNDYTWAKIRGDQGIPGKPGVDGKPKYTWIKYADTPTSGMSDNPTGKAYLGLAYNKDTSQESNNYNDYTWSKIKGDNGVPGPPGPPGVDGDIGDFPNSLPATPQVTTKVGFKSIEVSWTYENKVYYDYEVYASQVKNFNPNAFDLIFKGKASTFSHEVAPSQTWYYRVRSINSHGNATQFSYQAQATTTKIADGAQYFENAAIADALIGELRLDRGWVGKLTGTWIDARNLTVTEGNGKRTLDIDSFGRIRANFTSIQLNSEDVSTIPYVDGVKNEMATEIKGFEEKITPDALKRVFSTEFYTKDSANAEFTSKTELEQNNREFLLKIEQTGKPQLIPNGALREGAKFWNAWQAQRTMELFGGLKWFTITPQFELGFQSFGIMLPEMEVQSGKVYTVGGWVSGDVDTLNYNFLMQLKGDSMVGVQRINSISVGDVSKQAKRVSITFTASVTGFVQPMLGYEGVMDANLKLRVAEACCFEGYFLYPYQEAHNTIYNSDAYFDITGMGMKHKDGSVSRITHESFELTDVYERLKMAMKKGTLYAYDVENGNLLGMFGSNRLNTQYKGVTTGIAGSSHYYAIGVSHELTDTSDLTMKPYMVIAQQDLQNVFGMSRMSAGINFMNTKAIFHEPVHCMRYFAGTGVYSPNSILSLGYTDVTSNYQTAFAVDGGVQRLKGYMPLDMNGWQIYNASLGYSVVNNEVPMSFKFVSGSKAGDSVFDEIEVVNPSTRSFKTSKAIDSIGELDVTNVTNKDEIMLDENSADLGKLVTVLFKEVKDLKEEVRRLKVGD